MSLAFRASTTIDAKSSGTPVSLTQTLADLRLTHARLLEEHGTIVSLLRQREVQLTELEQRESEAQESIFSLQEELLAAKEGITRRETRAVLAEREVGFLQALLASYDAEAEAEVSDKDKVDQVKVQRIQQLETLLLEYKAILGGLEKQLEGFGGGSSMPGSCRNRQELSEEVEKERSERMSLQSGKQFSYYFIFYPIMILHHLRVRKCHFRNETTSRQD